MAVNEQGNLVPDNMGAKPEVVETKHEPSIPSAEKTLEAIKARVKAANPELANPDNVSRNLPKGNEPGKPDQVKTEPEIKPNDKAVLSELAKAQANLREAQAKVKTLEAQTGDSAFGAEIKKLWTGNDADKLAVLAKISGKDATEALAELVELFYNQEAGTGTTSQPKPVDANAELLKQIQELSNQVKELKELPAKQQTQQSQEQMKAGARAYLQSQIEKLKPEISSRPENVQEAIDKAVEKAGYVAKKLGFDLASLTPDQAEQLAKESILEAEKDFEQLGKRFSKVTEPVKSSIYDRTIPRHVPRLDMTKDDSKPLPTGKSWEEYKNKIRNAWESSKN